MTQDFKSAKNSLDENIVFNEEALEDLKADSKQVIVPPLPSFVQPRVESDILFYDKDTEVIAGKEVMDETWKKYKNYKQCIELLQKVTDNLSHNPCRKLLKDRSSKLIYNDTITKTEENNTPFTMPNKIEFENTTWANNYDSLATVISLNNIGSAISPRVTPKFINVTYLTTSSTAVKYEIRTTATTANKIYLHISTTVINRLKDDSSSGNQEKQLLTQISTKLQNNQMTTEKIKIDIKSRKPTKTTPEVEELKKDKDFDQERFAPKSSNLSLNISLDCSCIFFTLIFNFLLIDI